MITVKCERDGDEFHAFIPQMKGCHSHGRTAAEALVNLSDAARLWILQAIHDAMAQHLANPKR